MRCTQCAKTVKRSVEGISRSKRNSPLSVLPGSLCSEADGDPLLLTCPQEDFLRFHGEAVITVTALCGQTQGRDPSTSTASNPEPRPVCSNSGQCPQHPTQGQFKASKLKLCPPQSAYMPSVSAARQCCPHSSEGGSGWWISQTQRQN